MKLFKALISLTFLALVSACSHVTGIENNVDEQGVAIKGYDPVAYFTESKPVEGAAQYTAQFNGATYQFASAKNRDLFTASPDRYAPQYGGFCAYGVTKKRKFSIEPDAWKIVDGKLYLNLNKKVQKIWEKDQAALISEADTNWVDIKAVSDKELAKDF